MKKRTIVLLVLIVLSLAVFFGYRAWDGFRTDSTAPEITVAEQTLQVSVLDPRSMLLQGVTATDSADGDVTASLVVESVQLRDSSGTAEVRIAAFDSAGNVAKATRLIQYTDYESPRFTLSRALVFAQGTSFDVLNYIDVTDALDGDISHRIRATALDEVSIANLGTHDVEFRVTNSLGETVTLVLPVEVYPSSAYSGTVALNSYLVYLDQGDSFRAEDYLVSCTFIGETVSLSGGMPDGYVLQTSGKVDTGTPGVYEVSYKVTYARDVGTETHTYSGYTKLIAVVEG